MVNKATSMTGLISAFLAKPSTVSGWLEQTYAGLLPACPLPFQPAEAAEILPIITQQVSARACHSSQAYILACTLHLQNLKTIRIETSWLLSHFYIRLTEYKNEGWAIFRLQILFITYILTLRQTRYKKEFTGHFCLAGLFFITYISTASPALLLINGGSILNILKGHIISIMAEFLCKYNYFQTKHRYNFAVYYRT